MIFTLLWRRVPACRCNCQTKRSCNHIHALPSMARHAWRGRNRVSISYESLTSHGVPAASTGLSLMVSPINQRDGTMCFTAIHLLPCVSCPDAFQVLPGPASQYKDSTRSESSQSRAPPSSTMSSFQFPSYDLGPLVLGLAFNWGLQSVLTVQTYIYYLCFPHDHWTQKCLVYVLCIYEWVQTGLITAFIYRLLLGITATQSILSVYDDLELFSGNAWVTIYIMGAVQSAAVQIYFSRRIYILSRSYIIPCFTIFVALAQLSAGLVGGVQRLKTDKDFVRDDYDANFHYRVLNMDVATCVWLAASTICDVTIAVSLVVLLFRLKNGLRWTNIIINRLINLVIETGSLTAVTAVVTFGLFVGVPNTELAICPLLILSKLYANSVLITLNNRVILKSGQHGDLPDAIVLKPTVHNIGHMHDYPTIDADHSSIVPHVPIIIAVSHEVGTFVSKDEEEGRISAGHDHSSESE
ncbi:uncharacterized protein LAESUDRAFT_236210 [Laetiporus sulphureus 93-53]|uniref:DUF6534 domain-containing protein n=1 Tax=Laetiporus sulphureus 93-53 TaxID=1314785 RepID=A0A165DN66_9APHY|nr:uncharacterized protein LAESUDRAFT_236210 [Laetiporus sulphureus 93-53]KZT05252.1 hypothetical protein LAESUDRAFT_236210 [Laetiporus sulphureus 93-53]